MISQGGITRNLKGQQFKEYEQQAIAPQVAEVAAYAASAETARAAAETAQSNAEAAAQEAATATSTALEYANNAATSATAADSSSQEAAGYAAAMQECEPYDASKTYAIANMVTSGGSTYRCIKPCTGIQPPNDEYWLLIAEAGTDGVSPTVETSKEGKTTTITITDATGTHTATIQDGLDGTGAGDMTAAVYDPAGGAKQVAFADELSGAATEAVSAHNSDSAAHQALFGNKQAKITASGILKGNGSGGISAAEAGADYVAPSVLADYIPASQKGVATGVATLDSSGKVTAEQASSRIIEVSTNANITPGHAGRLIKVDSANAVTLTLINGTSGSTQALFSSGAELEIMNTGTGEVSIMPSAGNTINGSSDSLTISGQYGCVVLKLLGDTGTFAWAAKGDIS